MWWLIALRGLRRGEAAGLRWADVDLDAGVAMIEQQRIANGHLVTVGQPKTAASRRLIALDRHTVRLLREHRRRQHVEQKAANEVWQNTGYVFVAKDGAALHPDVLTRRFRHLVGESGLPPVRLHDLRPLACAVPQRRIGGQEPDRVVGTPPGVRWGQRRTDMWLSQGTAEISTVDGVVS
ncbi:tyrosine-type recombinase/integrase [Actinoplanes sp. NPDC051470]|uniref:tyrosine-type recombinase/integrase n=1 Tax=Actinoplanes sp. NPDC051470 TaxID=3157224 RepID=UPI003448869D